MNINKEQNKLKEFYRNEILNKNTKVIDFLIGDYVDTNLALEQYGGDDASALDDLISLAEEFLGYNGVVHPNNIK